MNIDKATGPTSGGQVTDYTEEINLVPNAYGRIHQLGLFSSEGVATRTVTIDKVVDTLEVLPEVPVGAPASRAISEDASELTFRIPHIPHEDQLLPEDLQDRRRPGSTDPDTADRNRAKKLELLRRRQAQTLEFLRMGALKGVITGGSGKAIYDLYSAFGIAKKTINFQLNNASTNVASKVLEVKRHIEDNALAGTIVDDILVYVDPAFWDLLTTHAKVEDAFKYFQANNQLASLNPNRDDLRQGFNFQGVTFVEYNASVKLLAQPSATPFIASERGHAFPIGVDDMFKTYFAPANHLDYVNTEGLEVYAWTYTDPKGRFEQFTSESNPLPLCRRPQALVECQAT